MSLEKSTLQRIDDLLQRSSINASAGGLGELQMTAISICVSLYGKDSPQVRSIEATRKELWSSRYLEDRKQELLAEHLEGRL